ncbi:hypothetical protein [Levilactobacillus wangkuiensis]|uniref:hypothetical protein n=1 Tax=Levilactobacillus wangkuiensis TaxID=2799566 RepID=UPI0019404AD7|nr:hypothetical protein [Levilactobacillus wangkuiensis]
MAHKKHWLTVAVALLAAGSLAGCTSNMSSRQAKNAFKQSQSSSKQGSGKTAKDESIIAAAQSLNADGKYKQSNKKLSSINLTDLNKKGFGALKTEFFSLQKSNDKFLLKKTQSKGNSATTTQASGGNTTTTTTTNNSFDGYSKYVGDYYFYNDDDGDRQQETLTIHDNGSVVQNNNDGSAFHGTATIKDSGAHGVLSYDVTTGTNDTKTIDANVEIDVVWSNGEHETYYGYTSYDDDIVLTDGNSYDGDLVNEVWMQ